MYMYNYADMHIVYECMCMCMYMYMYLFMKAPRANVILVHVLVSSDASPCAYRTISQLVGVLCTSLAATHLKRASTSGMSHGPGQPPSRVNKTPHPAG